LEKARAAAEQLEGPPPLVQVHANAGLDGGLALFPGVFVRRAVEGGLCDAEEETHEGDALMGFDSEVAQFMGMVEQILKAEQIPAAVGAQSGDPGINSQIHRRRLVERVCWERAQRRDRDTRRTSYWRAGRRSSSEHRGRRWQGFQHRARVV
jgi:hypothetical protein